jgi:predicted ABC-class ATPase
MDTPGQQVLETSAVKVTSEFVEARFTVALPAAGRSVLGLRAAQLLAESLPGVVRGSLHAAAHEAAAMRRHVDSVDDQEALRAMLRNSGLVAFGESK